jgi:hypothetical protein
MKSFDIPIGSPGIEHHLTTPDREKQPFSAVIGKTDVIKRPPDSAVISVKT